jgi:hypothetical protein
VEQNKAERFSNQNVDYYASNPNCNYSWVESCSGKVVNNAVKTSGTKPYYIGRVFASNSLQIGKVKIGDRMYYAPKFSAVNYKVLVCNRKREYFSCFALSSVNFSFSQSNTNNSSTNNSTTNHSSTNNSAINN